MLNTTTRFCTECGGVDQETGGPSPIRIQECECEHQNCTHRLYSQQKIAIAAIENLPLELLWEMHSIANNVSTIWAIKLFRESVGASLFQAKAVLEHTAAVTVPVELSGLEVAGVAGATISLQVVTLAEIQDATAQRAAEDVLEQFGVTI